MTAENIIDATYLKMSKNAKISKICYCTINITINIG